MNRFSHPIVALSLLVLAGCSDPPLRPADLERVESCVRDLRYQAQFLKSNGADRPDGAQALKTEYEMVVGALNDTERYLAKIKASGKREKFSWAFSTDEKGCPLSEISATMRIRKEKGLDGAPQQSAATDLDRMNREIDAAQNAVLEEYRRKAVEHTFTTGAGIRVDQFVMKSGEIVHCKTSISDYGKAVDCN